MRLAVLCGCILLFVGVSLKLALHEAFILVEIKHQNENQKPTLIADHHSDTNTDDDVLSSSRIAEIVMTPAMQNKEVKSCDWQDLEKGPLYPAESDEWWDHTFMYFNSLNITYALWNGALLGAVRHYGKIPGDGDIDLIIPVWLNPVLIEYAFSDSSEKNDNNNADDCLNRQKSNGFKVVLEKNENGDSVFCGMTRNEWTEIVRKWFSQVETDVKPKTRDGRVYLDRRPFGGFRFAANNGVQVDVMVSINDHKFWTTYTKPPLLSDHEEDPEADRLLIFDPKSNIRHALCRCRHNGKVDTLCFVNSRYYAFKMYGADYLTPDRPSRGQFSA